MAFIRKVKTQSGAIAVQIVHKNYGQVTRIDHIGSAHSQVELAALTTLAKQRLLSAQQSLFPDAVSPLQIQLKQSYSSLLWQVLHRQYEQLGFNQLGDDVFTALCIARVVEPTSKLDSLRVLADLGIHQFDKNQLYRCLQKVIDKDYRSTISQLCFSQAASHGFNLLLYDVTTLYFEVQQEDDYRKSGLSKERRLEPQILIGLLVDQSGFPLDLHSFEGNTAETKTILPVVKDFCAQHSVDRLTIVADAAMLSANNLAALAKSGFTYIVGSRLHKIPYDIAQYQKNRILGDQQIIVSQYPEYRVIYQYRDKRAALDRRNIQKQIDKAQKIVCGQTATTKAKFVTLKAQTKQLNQSLIDKAYALAGIKGYVTNLDIPSQQVIDYYHQLFQVAKLPEDKLDLEVLRIVDDILAIDAGGLVSSLTFSEQIAIKSLLVTHHHYDHIKDIPMLGMSFYVNNAQLHIYSLQSVLEALEYLFKYPGNLYFNSLQRPAGNPTFRFTTIAPLKPFIVDGYHILPVPVKHSVPTMGYQITSPAGKSLFYTGDTGSGLADRWQHISPEVLVIEVTAANEFIKTAIEAKHLTPSLLKEELASFQNIKGYLPKIITVHMFPQDQRKIEVELKQVATELNATIIPGYEDMQITL